MSDNLDVAIIGGGPAGLSAALTLARARRSVVVIDSGEPRNAPSPAVHGFLTRDGIAPAELLRVARAEVESHGARLVDDRVVDVTGAEGAFDLTLAGGTTLSARRLLVTTGLVDELPDVAGVRELWGDQVIHCPYCHGWEARDQAIGILGSGPMSTHQALLFRQLSDDVVVFSHTHPPSAEQRAELAARGVDVIDQMVEALDRDDDGRLVGVRLAGGETAPGRRWWWRRGSSPGRRCSTCWASTWSSRSRASGCGWRPTPTGARTCRASGWRATSPTCPPR